MESSRRAGRLQAGIGRRHIEAAGLLVCSKGHETCTKPRSHCFRLGQPRAAASLQPIALACGHFCAIAGAVGCEAEDSSNSRPQTRQQIRCGVRPVVFAPHWCAPLSFSKEVGWVFVAPQALDWLVLRTRNRKSKHMRPNAAILGCPPQAPTIATGGKCVLELY